MSLRQAPQLGIYFSCFGAMVTPEAQEGGPLALVVDNDIVTLDADKNRLDVAVSDVEMETRRAKWQAPPLKATRGTLFKYIKTVKSASEGCVTDE